MYCFTSSLLFLSTTTTVTLCHRASSQTFGNCCCFLFVVVVLVIVVVPNTRASSSSALHVLRVRVRQNGPARRGDGRFRGDLPDARGRVQDGDFLLLALLLGRDDGDVLPGVVEGRADLGLLVLVGHSLGALELFHQVVDLDSEGLLAVVDLTVEEQDVRLVVGRNNGRKKDENRKPNADDDVREREREPRNRNSRNTRTNSVLCFRVPDLSRVWPR